MFDVNVDVDGLGMARLRLGIGGTVGDIQIITLPVDPPQTVLTFQAISLTNTNHQFLKKKYLYFSELE